MSIQWCVWRPLNSAGFWMLERLASLVGRNCAKILPAVILCNFTVHRFLSRRHKKKERVCLCQRTCVVYLLVNSSRFCAITSRQKLSFIAAEFMIFLVRLHKAGHCSFSFHEICLWVFYFLQGVTAQMWILLGQKQYLLLCSW